MTKKEIERITDYLNTKGSFSNYFKGYSKMYSITTENVSGFLNKYDLKDKKILTVAGSGDQRLNCYLNGASDVVCFDINPLAELHIELKESAIQDLDYSDFRKFFGIGPNGSNDFLEKRIFDDLKMDLDDDVYLFYNFLINKYKRQLFGDVYHDIDYKISKMHEFSNYLKKDNYNKIGKILEKKNINFINANIANLPELLDGEKFDMILLSNISDYIHIVYSDNHMERYKELIDKLVDNLYLDGVIQVGYIYSRYGRGEDVSKFHLDVSRNKVFPSYIYNIDFVNSFYGDGTYDKIVTYQKIKQ